MASVQTVWYSACFEHDTGRLTYFAMDGFSRANAKDKLVKHPDFAEFKEELELAQDRIVRCMFGVAETTPIRAGLQSIVTLPNS